MSKSETRNPHEDEVASFLLKNGATQSDNEISFLCPVHDNHNPSASYNVQKQVWTCFSCGAGGGRRESRGKPWPLTRARRYVKEFAWI